MNRYPNPIKPAIALSVLWTASYFAWPFYYTNDRYLVLGLWALTAYCSVKFIYDVSCLAYNWFYHRWVMRARAEKGSAHWSGEKQAKAAGLFSKKTKQKGFLAGLMGRTAVWVNLESSGLVLSPAGGGKTVGFIIPALMHNDMSMVVPDLKGTLSVQTGEHRRKRLGHDVHYLNPGELYKDHFGKGSRYNPLQLLINDWNDPERHKFMVTDAQSIAKQLVPEPKTKGENEFFRSGSRKLLTYAFLYLITQNSKTTLSEVLTFISDMMDIETSLYTAQCSEALSGDVKRLALDLTGKMSGSDRRQMESFREGALQALEPYSPSGVLAEATEASDFSFAGLRTQKGTIYIICDPTQADVFENWVGLVMLNAINELIRTQTNRPVCLLLDECTNFKIENLPKYMTSLREFKIIMWLVVQELEQFVHLYGKEAKETLLSQTEVKIIHGARSPDTCELVSKMLGDKSMRVTTYNTGRDYYDRIGRNVTEQARRLLTPDEVARFTDMIVFVKNMAPMALSKVGYHEVHPWRDQVAPNPLFGNKKFKEKVRLRV